MKVLKTEDSNPGGVKHVWYTQPQKCRTMVAGENKLFYSVTRNSPSQDKMLK